MDLTYIRLIETWLKIYANKQYLSLDGEIIIVFLKTWFYLNFL